MKLQVVAAIVWSKIALPPLCPPPPPPGILIEAVPSVIVVETPAPTKLKNEDVPIWVPSSAI